MLDYVENTQPTLILACRFHEESKLQLMEPAIVNLNEVDDIQKWLEDDNHVYVGRKHGTIEASPWGNPFKVGDDDIDSIGTCLTRYEEHVTSSQELSIALGSLKMKNLGCWCPKRDQCHASVLFKLLGN